MHSTELACNHGAQVLDTYFPGWMRKFRNTADLTGEYTKPPATPLPALFVKDVKPGYRFRTVGPRRWLMTDFKYYECFPLAVDVATGEINHFSRNVPVSEILSPEER